MSKAFGRVARREVGSATPYSALHESEQNICDAILHVLLGLGLGWISVLALSIEMASLQQTQPEGLALAAIAGTAGTVGNTIIVPLFFFIQHYRYIRGLEPIPSGRWILIAFLCQSTAVALGSFCATSTTGDTSWAVILIAFVGAFGANLTRLAAVPWVMTSGLAPSNVSWLLAGGSATALICALLGVTQQPGGAEHFSVHAFFRWLALLVVASIVAYGLLLVRRAAAVQPQLVRLHPRQESRLGVAAADEMDDDGQVDSYAPGFSLPYMYECAQDPIILRCIGTNAAVQYICWILIGFLLPYASAHAMRMREDNADDGGVVLGYAAELSTVAVFLGSVVSSCVPVDSLHCGCTLSLMLLCLAVLLALIFDALPLATSATLRAAALITSVTLARFIDGLVTPLLYRRAAEQASGHARREAITQLQAAVSILATSAGTWIVLWMLHSGYVS